MLKHYQTQPLNNKIPSYLLFSVIFFSLTVLLTLWFNNEGTVTDIYISGYDTSYIYNNNDHLVPNSCVHSSQEFVFENKFGHGLLIRYNSGNLCNHLDSRFYTAVAYYPDSSSMNSDEQLDDLQDTFSGKQTFYRKSYYDSSMNVIVKERLKILREGVESAGFVDIVRVLEAGKECCTNIDITDIEEINANIVSNISDDYIPLAYQAGVIKTISLNGDLDQLLGWSSSATINGVCMIHNYNYTCTSTLMITEHLDNDLVLELFRETCSGDSLIKSYRCQVYGEKNLPELVAAVMAFITVVKTFSECVIIGIDRQYTVLSGISVETETVTKDGALEAQVQFSEEVEMDV